MNVLRGLRDLVFPPACLLCGLANIDSLTPAPRSILEAHHLVGRANDGELGLGHGRFLRSVVVVALVDEDGAARDGGAGADFIVCPGARQAGPWGPPRRAACLRGAPRGDR